MTMLQAMTYIGLQSFTEMCLIMIIAAFIGSGLGSVLALIVAALAQKDNPEDFKSSPQPKALRMICPIPKPIGYAYSLRISARSLFNRFSHKWMRQTHPRANSHQLRILKDAVWTIAPRPVSKTPTATYQFYVACVTVWIRQQYPGLTQMERLTLTQQSWRRVKASMGIAANQAVVAI